jgi:SWI/SNF-related matrix-associated actin-dependent regulator 1 of chromatin subfamily A
VLYEHQTTGAEWLASRPNGRGYLGDPPGLGKTRTIIEALKRSGAKAPLIVCPAIVRTHWARESREMNYAPGIANVRSFDEIVRGGIPLLKQIIGVEKRDSLVIDEVHMCKHAGSKRTQLILGPNGYARRLPVVFAASGTPVPKNAKEFATVLLTLFPHVAIEHGVETIAKFQARFCYTSGSMVRGAWREKILPVVQNAEEFKAILAKVMLRRENIDAPELAWQITRLDGGTLDTYEDGAEVRHALDMGYALEEIENDPHVARMRRRLGELKVEPVVQMLTSQLADSDEKVVVFAHHTEVLERLRFGLEKFGVAFIDGSVGTKRRDREIDRFVNDPAYRIFLGQNIACGTGMDGLQHSGARRAILVEPDWSAYMNEQLGKRLARTGQRAGSCIGQMIALAGTLDEAIVGQNLQETRMVASIGLGENQ